MLHLSVITILRVLVPPPKYAEAAEVMYAESLPPIVPQREPPEPVVEDPNTPFGERAGEGKAINSVELPDTSRSEKPIEQEQAWSSRQPVVSAQNQQEQSSKKSAALVPSGLQSDLPAMSREKIGKGESKVEVAPQDRPTDERASDGSTNEGKQGEEQRNAEKAKSAPDAIDPAPQGPSDADAFAEAEGVSLIGNVKARKGRELKIARPRIDLAFRAAFTRLADRQMRLVFRITTDETGNPRNVEILKSTGSTDIDEAVRLAMYDSWFGGKMPDTFPFVIAFYD